VYPVFEHEIQGLQFYSPTLPLTFFGVSAGAAVSFGSVVFSSSLPQERFPVFNALFWVSVVLALFFALLSVGAYLISHRLVGEIRKRPGALPGPPVR